ncbi:MAG: hypothetical protein H6671_16440 [Anaerolineaceae bacterium]|nr:hypothetical protein [Anaerolineaceae bacterium]
MKEDVKVNDGVQIEEKAMPELTQVQKLHIELIRCISRNDFDGQIVADGLLAHTDLWVGVISAHSHQPHPVYRLFDEIPENRWFADRLWIMAVDEKSARRLVDLCRTEWQADEAGIYDCSLDTQLSKVTMVDSEVLVAAWWD